VSTDPVFNHHQFSKSSIFLLVKRVQIAKTCVWDGENEGDRPLTHEEMQAGIEAYRCQRERPTGSDKESTTMRFDCDVLGRLSRRWSRLANPHEHSAAGVA
jgi:YD repeat-containing protein